jgi:hypothetical protein
MFLGILSFLGAIVQGSAPRKSFKEVSLGFHKGYSSLEIVMRRKVSLGRRVFPGEEGFSKEIFFPREKCFLGEESFSGEEGFSKKKCFPWEENFSKEKVFLGEESLFG